MILWFYDAIDASNILDIHGFSMKETLYKIMFGLIKKMLIGLSVRIGSFGESLVSNWKGSIKCVSLNNHPYQARPTIIYINSDETLFYTFSVSGNKCGKSCNIIDDPYARVCVPKKEKNMNVKVFNLMSRVSETRLLVQHEMCE